MTVPNAFIETKNALLDYYSSIRARLGVNLIGFTAGLFTLIQTVQYSKEEPLSEIFSNVHVPFEIAPNIADILKLFVFSVGVWFLVFFIFRTILRFTVFAYFSEYVLRVAPTEISERTEPIHEAIHIVVTDNMCIRDRKKIYGGIPISWCIARGENSKHQIGNLLCGVLAIVWTLVFIWLLW